MNELLERLTSTVTTARSVEEVVRPFLDLLCSLTGMESTYLTKVDLVINEQEVLFALNSGDLQIPEGLSVIWHDTLCKRALESSQWFTSNVPECWPDSVAAREIGIQSYLSTPIYLPDGNLYGTLCAASKQQVVFDETTRTVLSLFARLITQQVEREQFVQNLLQLNQRLMLDSSQDPLTGLFNRRTLLAELSKLLVLGSRQGFLVLIAFIDLDGFKAINDRHGHATGDRFLRQVSHRLAQGMRLTDMTARIGGDEFVVIGTGPHVGGDISGAIENFKQRAFDAIRGLYAFDELQIDYPGASVGVIAVAPDELEAEQAIEKADQAMYAIKAVRKLART